MPRSQTRVAVPHRHALRAFAREKAKVADMERIYRDIVARCDDPTHPLYPENGARGITCEWKTFAEFYRDMAASYPG